MRTYCLEPKGIEQQTSDGWLRQVVWSNSIDGIQDVLLKYITSVVRDRLPVMTSWVIVEL